MAAFTGAFYLTAIPLLFIVSRRGTRWLQAIGREAFSAIESGAGPEQSSALVFWQSLIEGARAHIEGDLPRVLADVYGDHNAARCDYVRFRADFLLMAPIFSRAWGRLKRRVPRVYLPTWMRTMDRFAPPELVEALTARRMYDPLLHRRLAFERGRELLARG